MVRFNYGGPFIDMSFGMQSQPRMLLNLINSDDMVEVVTDSCYGMENMRNAFQTQVLPYYNCRERGFLFKIWITSHTTKNLLKINQNTCLNMVWFEHRNSDSMVVLKWKDEGVGEHLGFRENKGSYTVDDIKDIEHNESKNNVYGPYESKWDFTEQFSYLDFKPMLKYFWSEVENFIKYYSKINKVVNPDDGGQ